MFRQSKEDVVRNLKDAGCSQQTIEQFMECLKRGTLSEQMELLSGTATVCWIRCTENRDGLTVWTIWSTRYRENRQRIKRIRSDESRRRRK